MPSSNALSVWREEVGRQLLNLDFRPEGDHPFYFQMKPVLVSGGIRVVQNLHGPGFTIRDRELIRDENNSVALIYPMQGSLHYSQEDGGHLRRTDVKLLFCEKPGQLGAPVSSNYMSIIFERSEIPSNIDLDRLGRSPWKGTTPALRLLRSYVHALNGTVVPPESNLAKIAHHHILDLVRQAAGEQSQTDKVDLGAESTIGEARLRIALGDIEQYFRDPRLTEVDIALRQGITPRHLQRLFERAGLRFTECVNAKRLEAAYRALADSAMAHRSVIEIAFDSGFSDISHFNRVFKRHYGATPSDVRSGGKKA